MTGSRKGTPTAILQERRSAARIATALSATVTVARRTIRFTVEDLSVTGARLVGPLPLTLGQRIRVSFGVDSENVNVVAEVVRIRSANLLTDRAAVRFVDLCARSRAAIVSLVARGIGIEQGQDVADDGATGRLPRRPSEVDLDAATYRYIRTAQAHGETDIDAATARYVKKKGSA